VSEEQKEGMRPFGKIAVSRSASINRRGVDTMMPPDFFLFLHHQRQQELVRQVEQARLVRARRKKSNTAWRVFQPFFCRLGGSLLSWGCALQGASGATNGIEKVCCVCCQ
jgi:hypothetical protein